MKTKALVMTAMFLGAVVVLAGPAWSGDESGEKQAAGAEQAHGMDPAAMEAWAKVSQPGEFHTHLQPLVGNWKFVGKWRMTADAPWTDSAGTSTYKWILGNRFLTQDYNGGMFMGQAFVGFGIMGYDNIKKQYTSAWMDNMGTQMMPSHGTCDSSGKVFTYAGVYDDVVSGKEKKTESILRIINNDKHVFEMYGWDDAGKKFLSMELIYTRG